MFKYLFIIISVSRNVYDYICTLHGKTIKTFGLYNLLNKHQHYQCICNINQHYGVNCQNIRIISNNGKHNF